MENTSFGLSTKKTSEDLHVQSTGNIFGSVTFLSSAVSIPEASASSKQKFNWRVILLPKFWIVALSICSYAFGVSTAFQGIANIGKESGVFFSE